ncbi:MAG TPA: hypothetical protein VFS92_02475 [Planctomycetota bacterium]|nr:hypothetical protein [Planctomycetota bacterium]
MSSIYSNLRVRFAPPDWNLFEEVTLGGRRMDALAVARDSSYAIWGFEVKEHRSDWLREVQNPMKALPLVEAVDSWYVVAPADIVKPGELPPGWGLMNPRGETLRVVTRSAVNHRGPVSRELLHRVIWQLSERASRAEGSEKYHEGRVKQLEEELAAGTAGKDAVARVEYAEERAAAAEKALADLNEKVRLFSAQSGIPLSDGWADGYLLGEAVRAVRSVSARARMYGYLDNAARAADAMKEAAKHALEALDTLEPKKPDTVEAPTGDPA